MSNTLLLCEPNIHLPQKIFVDSLRRTERSDNKIQEVNIKPAEVRSLYAPLTEYKVLPLYHEPDEEIKIVLSLDSNEYLRIRWRDFLEKLPKYYVKIKLYKDFMPKENLSRKKSLNGQVYGIDNKLAPLPYMPDPRSQHNVKPPELPSRRCSPKKKRMEII